MKPTVNFKCIATIYMTGVRAEKSGEVTTQTTDRIVFLKGNVYPAEQLDGGAYTFVKDEEGDRHGLSSDKVALWFTTDLTPDPNDAYDRAMSIL